MPRTPDLTKWTYEAMFERLMENEKAGSAPLYYETRIEWNNPLSTEPSDFAIAIRHFNTVIAVVHEDRSVTLVDPGGARGTWSGRRWNGTWTETTKRRLGYLLMANCKKNLASVRGTLKVYSVSTGQYTEFRKGMVVTKDA